MNTKIRAIIVTVLVASLWIAGDRARATGQGLAPSRQESPSKLFKDSRQVLAIARVAGRRDVSLLLAAQPASNDAIAREATRLGGAIRYRDDEIGYLRVRLPIDRVGKLVALDHIEAVALDIDESVPLGLDTVDSQLSSQADGSQERRWPPRPDNYPLQDPYSPHKDLDADGFLARQPSWDGRGVTVAVLDGHADFLLPELQLAWTGDGRPVPKIADVLNVTDPREDADDIPQWVNMRDQATAQVGRLIYQGKSFSVPRDGTYRIGFFNERRFSTPSNAAYIDKDIDRNGNPKDDDGLFGVLWDETTNEVWVDSDRNLSFADNKPMMDYRVRHDVGVFGKDKPDTPIRESIGFTVQTDHVNNFISINVGLYQHGTMVIGALAANRRPHGKFDGVAPGLNLVDEPSLASRAVSVGGYQSKESYRRNWGFVPVDDDNMHWGGLSHGPSGSGALKPDLLSPSGHLGNDPGYRMGGAMKGLYRLPPGYTIGGGTSEATPVATGAVTLLISAAKQAGVPHDAERLKAAITSSARWISRLGAFEQGCGLIQVGAAWEVLKSMAKAPARVAITSRAPVKTVLSYLLGSPNEGIGLYEREGWTPSARGERTVTFARTSGTAEPMTFTLSWQGNDGTFTSPSSVTLPLGKPVAVPGVWEIDLWNGQDARLFDPDAPEPVPATPVTVTATLVGFDADTTEEAQGGSETALSFTLTGKNRFSALAAAFAPASLGSAVDGRRAIAGGEQQTFEVVVPKGSNAIWARIGRAAAPNADLDLYLFDCSGEKCALRAKSIGIGSDEWVTVSNPMAGRWVVLVDAHAVPDGRTDYDYLDVVTNPRFGSVHVADTAEERAAGTAWNAKGHAWIASAPDVPRRLYALVPIVSPSAQTIGRPGTGAPRPPPLLGFAELPLARKATNTATRVGNTGR